MKSRLSTGNIPFETKKRKIYFSLLKPEDRKKIGGIAKKKKVEWYKRIDLGELLGDIIFDNWEQIEKGTTLRRVVEELSNWVVDND